MTAFAMAMVVTPWVSEDLFGWMIFRETGPAPGAPDDVADFLRFSHGVLGAVMVGWFLLMVWVIKAPLAQGWDGAWAGLTVSLGGWFLLDTTYSLLSGYWENAVLNAVVLVAYVPGLLATRR